MPAPLADTHGLDPAVGRWAFTPRRAVATPDGDTYVVSTVWRTWQGKGDPTDPYCQLNCRSITRYTPDGTPVATALFGHPRPDGTLSAIIPDGDGDILAVLPDGTIALSLRPGSTHLDGAPWFSAGNGRRFGEFGSHDRVTCWSRRSVRGMPSRECRQLVGAGPGPHP
ncbi:hypothetical protein ACFC1R_36995 [Kitasatospora sp. NPDC056138]|uniref:hypothetical protein n=1 Tax=Kitasatospora sp. NPDC056138 TaxID=3345724 RepID=UPI0035D76A44